MSNLSNYYKEVLSNLDFSIIGYNNLERKLQDYLIALSESDWLRTQDNIELISCAYSKLVDFPFEIESLDTRTFFFHSFFERSFEKIFVNEYWYFRKKLDKILFESNRVNTSETYARLFDKNPTSFSVKCMDANVISVKYNHHLDLLTINLSYKNIFKFEDGDKLTTVKRKILETFENKFLNDEAINYEYLLIKDSSVYKSGTYNENFIPWLDDFFVTDDKLKSLSKLLVTKFKLLNETNDFYFFSKGVDEQLIESFSKSVIAHALVSFLFNSYIENIPSVIYNDGRGTRRTLGTFIIGYKEPLDIEIRTQFRMLSEKISSVLAGNVAYQIYFNKITPKIPTIFSEMIDTMGIAELCHGDGKRYTACKAKENATTNILAFKQKLTYILSGEISAKANKLIEVSDELLQEVNGNGKLKSIRDKFVGLEVYKDYFASFDHDLKINYKQTSDRFYVCIFEYLNDSIPFLLQNLKTKYSVTDITICSENIITKELQATDLDSKGIVKLLESYIIIKYLDEAAYSYNPGSIPEVFSKINANIDFIGDFYFVAARENAEPIFIDRNYKKIEAIPSNFCSINGGNWNHYIFKYESYKHD